MVEQQYGKVRLKICNSREEMGKVAALEAAECIRELLSHKEQINCIFAAAPSQNEFIAHLLAEDLNWGRMNAFHMDEYVGLELKSPKSFSGFLDRSIFSKKQFRSVHFINGMEEPAEECARYTALLQEFPPDIVFLGIGDNGHIAFNDPPVADFSDPAVIKKVELDLACRTQQVNDKCFDSLNEVPKFALTLTIPTLVSAAHRFCIVPGIRKAEATAQALTGEVSIKCPASILQMQGCNMYIDKDCASKLPTA